METKVCPVCDSFMKGNFCKCGYRTEYSPDKKINPPCEICGGKGRNVSGRNLGKIESKSTKDDRVLCYDCYQRHYADRGFNRDNTVVYPAERVKAVYAYHKALFYGDPAPDYYGGTNE